MNGTRAEWQGIFTAPLFSLCWCWWKLKGRETSCVSKGQPALQNTQMSRCQHAVCNHRLMRLCAASVWSVWITKGEQRQLKLDVFFFFFILHQYGATSVWIKVLMGNSSSGERECWYRMWSNCQLEHYIAGHKSLITKVTSDCRSPIWVLYSYVADHSAT